MPASIRPDDKAKRIAYDILGAPVDGYTDSKGVSKKYRRKKNKGNVQESVINPRNTNAS